MNAPLCEKCGQRSTVEVDHSCAFELTSSDVSLEIGKMVPREMTSRVNDLVNELYNSAHTKGRMLGEKYAERWRLERRERIATACMQGLTTFGATAGIFGATAGIGSDFARAAVQLADALIAELDKKGAAR